MSGPKYSEAEIKQREQRRLERERQAKLEQKRMELEEAKKRYNLELKELDDMESDIRQLLNRIDSERNYLLKEKAKELLEKIRLYDRNSSGPKEILDNKSEVISKWKKTIKEEIEKIKVENSEDTIIHNISNIVGEKKRERQNVICIKKDVFEEYRKLLVDTEKVDNILEHDRKAIERYRERLKELLAKQNENNIFEIKQVAHFLETRLNSAKRKYQSWCSAYDEYLIKAEMVQIPQKKLFEFGSIDEIEQECDALDKASIEYEKMNYIASTIEDVMKQYGHAIIRSDIFSIQNQTFQREYFSFGDDSVLSVTQNTQGAVVMEVVIVDEDEHLSVADKRKAVDKMLDFCRQYPELMEELNNRGVVFKKIFDTPPGENCTVKVSRTALGIQGNSTSSQHRNNEEKIVKWQD